MADAAHPRQPSPGQTPSQTIGPFFHFSLPWEGGGDLVRGLPANRVIEIAGRVIDGAGGPVGDALVEIWQADAAGDYDGGSGFVGFGRCASDADGAYRFRTVFPGRVAAPGGGLQAPHVAVSVFARGLLKRLVTRIYFEDGEGMGDDPVLARVPAERRATLIATSYGAPDRYRFDIVLQGERETVFFDV